MYELLILSQGLEHSVNFEKNHTFLRYKITLSKILKINLLKIKIL